MASRIAVMSEGRFLQVGTPAEVYEHPTSRFVADFIGNVNLFDGALSAADGRVADVDCGDLHCRVASTRERTGAAAVTVAVRPEKMRIAKASGASLHADAVNRVDGTVRDIAYFGSYTVYHLKTASGRVVRVSQGHVDRGVADPLAVGDAASASWSETAAVVLDR